MRDRTIHRISLLAILAFSASLTSAFSPSNHRRSSSSTQILNAQAFPQPPGLDLSSTLISQLAIIALKLRLKDQTAVGCDVSARPSDVLHGRVGPVTVTGKGWQSNLGLTCRAIEATVDTCELDTSRVLADRKLVLTTPASGSAMIALSSVDFSNFLQHPLLRAPGSPEEGSDETVEFLGEGAKVNPSSGSVSFFAMYRGKKWECRLKRADQQQQERSKNAIVQVRGVDERDPAVARRMSAFLTQFFNEMVFELDGTFLSFRDMMVTDQGSTPSVLLSLSITVQKFPSPGMEF